MSDKRIFVLFGIAAAALVGGAVLATVVMPGTGWKSFGHGCTLGDAAGAQALAVRSEASEVQSDRGWRVTRVLAYEAPAAAEGSIAECTDTGAVALLAGDGSSIVVEARVSGHGGTEQDARTAAQGLQPEVRARGGALWAWQPSGLWRNVAVSFKVTVPATMLVDASLHTDTGGVKVDGARLKGLRATADTGGIELSPSWAQGDLSAHVDTGGVRARFPALGAASLVATTDTGGIGVAVPADARHGYDIRATADTGGITLDLPGLRDAEGNGDHARHARTDGYDTREVRVTMDLHTDTGSVKVEAT